jgi:hypothetical protein
MPSLFPEYEFNETVKTRKCNFCEKKLPLNMFWADASCKRTQCKDCAKEASKHLKLAKRLVSNPSPPPLGTPCEFCGEFRGKKLTFEHNHDTMEFRGWCCDPCNRGFGILERSLGTSDLNVVAERIKEYANKQRINLSQCQFK